MVLYSTYIKKIFLAACLKTVKKDHKKSIMIWQIYILQVTNWSPMIIDLACLYKMDFSMYISANFSKWKKKNRVMYVFWTFKLLFRRSLTRIYK